MFQLFLSRDRDPRRSARHLCPRARLPVPVGRPCMCWPARDSRARARGRRALHGARHVQGNAGDYPTTRAVSEAIEGCGGSSNAATDREIDRLLGAPPGRARPSVPSTSWRSWLFGRCCATRTSPASATSSSRRSARTATTPASTSSTCSTGPSSATRRSGWEIAGDEDVVRGLTDDDIRDFWVDCVPASQLWSSPSPATWTMPRSWSSCRATFGTGTAWCRRSSPRPIVPGRALRLRRARSRPGAPVPWRCRRCAATIPTSGRSSC